jgi:uncharacterized coiled-coil protein SlyX
MRMFSKFLVYANLVVSLVFLGWAVALFTQRLDWAPRKNLITGEFSQGTGLVNQTTEEIKALGENADLAERRWQTDAAMLPDVEGKRLAYQKWYEDQVLLGTKGKDSDGNTVNPPVVEIIKDDNGLIIIDPKKRQAAKSGDVAVQSLSFYENKYRELKAAIDETQKEIDRLVEQNKDLTQKIAGIPGKTKGARGELEAKVNYKRLFEDEMENLKPLLVTQRINIEQQKKRLAELQARLKELAGGAAALKGNGN